MKNNLPTKLNFSKSNFALIKKPKTGYKAVYDIKTPGLGMRLLPSGKQVFFSQGQIKGLDGKYRQDRFTIGPYPKITILNARQKAYEHASLRKEGISPRESEKVIKGLDYFNCQTLDALAESVIIINPQGYIDYINPYTENVLPIKRNKILGEKFNEVFSLFDEKNQDPLKDHFFLPKINQSLSLNSYVFLVKIDASGQKLNKKISIDGSASPIYDSDGSAKGVVLIIRDMDEFRGLNEDVSYQASHDPLTGIANRRELERQFILARNKRQEYIFFFLDLDRFKFINDALGHVVGDKILTQVVNLIYKNIRDEDIFARLGGDEFGLLLPRCSLPRANKIAQDICNTVKNHNIEWEAQTFNLGVSIGIVEVKNPFAPFDEILKAADSACYIAKQNGGGQAQQF
ncbi:MAG: diguanylate cyclase [Pseudomonadota bacterium]|nr:diguanylate cyclase [Pseudomonadota bacterium]